MNKLIKTGLLVFVSLTLVFIISIFGIVIPISESDKNWIPYEKGEVLFFRSTPEKVDSIAITNISVGSQGGITGLLKPQSIKVYASRNDSILTVFDQNKTVREMSFTLIGVTTSVPVFGKQEISVGIKDFRYIQQTHKLESSRLDSLLLKNELFRNVYVLVEQTNSKLMPDAETIEKVYWTKKEGLIGYVQYDGTIWLKQQRD